MTDYSLLSESQYKTAVVDLIAKLEAPKSLSVEDIGDGKATIGYGFTFGAHTNNVAIWQLSGIHLTAAEWNVLASIDSANTESERTEIALNNFQKEITLQESMQLLEVSYQEYESVADGLGMPFSWERVAVVSVTYNRGSGAVNSKMAAFKADITEGDFAEAWYELRYNAQTTNAAFQNGIANRRYVEAEKFGIFQDHSTEPPRICRRP